MTDKVIYLSNLIYERETKWNMQSKQKIWLKIIKVF